MDLSAKAQDLIKGIKGKVAVSGDRAYAFSTEQIAQKIVDLLSYHHHRMEATVVIDREKALDILGRLLLDTRIEKLELKVYQNEFLIINNKED